MGQTDRPDDRRAAGSRLPSNSESAVKRNHETPKSGIPKRKKIEACPRLSCKIQYLLASNHSDQSTASEYFTADKHTLVPGLAGELIGNLSRFLGSLSRMPDRTAIDALARLRAHQARMRQRGFGQYTPAPRSILIIMVVSLWVNAKRPPDGAALDATNGAGQLSRRLTRFLRSKTPRPLG